MIGQNYSRMAMALLLENRLDLVLLVLAQLASEAKKLEDYIVEVKSALLRVKEDGYAT